MAPLMFQSKVPYHKVPSPEHTENLGVWMISTNRGACGQNACERPTSWLGSLLGIYEHVNARAMDPELSAIEPEVLWYAHELQEV
jgi:hypothetical protein